MRITHRNPAADWFAVPVSDYVDPEYEAEVQQSTQRAERECRRAQARLTAAERRLAKALGQQRKASMRKQIAQLREVVDQRRAELEEIKRLMTAPIVAADKQIRQRTGLDDHLELGDYRRPPVKSVPPGPVTRGTARRDVA